MLRWYLILNNNDNNNNNDTNNNDDYNRTLVFAHENIVVYFFSEIDTFYFWSFSVLLSPGYL